VLIPLDPTITVSQCFDEELVTGVPSGMNLANRVQMNLENYATFVVNLASADTQN
jgi:hypothetical protein